MVVSAMDNCWPMCMHSEMGVHSNAMKRLRDPMPKEGNDKLRSLKIFIDKLHI